MSSEILGREQKSSEFGGEGKTDSGCGEGCFLRSALRVSSESSVIASSEQAALHPYSRRPRVSSKLALLSRGNHRRLDD